jgi:hypothetical protein
MTNGPGVKYSLAFIKHKRWFWVAPWNQRQKIMKKTKEEIINEINKSFSFLCWPYWMDRKGRIHESGSKPQAASAKQRAASLTRFK